MFVYSETSKAFIERVREEIRALFFLEIESVFPVKFNRSRILYKNFQFPLNIVVFEDNTKLGYFDYRHYEIGISKKLMYSAFDNVIRNVIRHELAHYLAFLFYGPSIGHGEKFKELCKLLNWNEEVSLAYSNIDLENLKIIEKESNKNIELLNKIKKLLALSASDNIHESEMATMKANQLLMEHNLSLINQVEKESDVFVRRVLTANKKNAKHIAIYEILKTFYVSPVFNHGKGSFYLEIVGSKANTEIAEYVAHFLDSELERLWLIAKKTSKLSGVVAKNSFFRGISKGYTAKIQQLKNTSPNQKDLITIDKNLMLSLKMVYNRLGSSYSSDLKSHDKAHHLGLETGSKLSINPGIKSKEGTKLLTF